MRQVPYVKTIIGDTETPITVFQKYVGDKIGFLLESKSKEKNRFSFIGRDPIDMILVQDQASTMAVLQDYLKEYDICNTSHLPFMGGVVGIMSYDAAREQMGVKSTGADVLKLPLAQFFFVTEFIAYDHDYKKILLVVIESDDLGGENKANKKLKYMNKVLERQLVAEVNQHKPIKGYSSNMSKNQFIEKVNKAKGYIRQGDASQIVVSQRWEAQSDIKPFQLYRNIRSLNPSPYLFYFNFGDYQIVGSSPEMLARIKKGKISTCPIAGTRKRGETDKEDSALEKELLSDPKEVKEHIMLVDLAKKDMTRVADRESIRVKDYMQVQRFSHVMHITSLVEGNKKEGLDSFQVLNSFLPAGTLSGSPRKRAMEIIDELEGEKRGFYGGAAGYIGCNQEMDMCIAIRMMIVKNGKIYMQAGAGIVADSDGEKEHEECENKVKALINSLYMGVIENEINSGKGH